MLIKMDYSVPIILGTDLTENDDIVTARVRELKNLEQIHIKKWCILPKSGAFQQAV